MKNVWLALAGVAGLTVACGSSYPTPTGHLVASESQVRAAQEIGAQSDAQGGLHLRLAQEQIDAAKKAMSDGDNERADFLLVRAKSDADLALMLARESKAKGETNQAQGQADSLKQSLTTGQPVQLTGQPVQAPAQTTQTTTTTTQTK